MLGICFAMTGVTFSDKWTTDNVLTTNITVEDQVIPYSFFFFPANDMKNSA